MILDETNIWKGVLIGDLILHVIFCTGFSNISLDLEKGKGSSCVPRLVDASTIICDATSGKENFQNKDDSYEHIDILRSLVAVHCWKKIMTYKKLCAKTYILCDIT